MNTRAKFRFRFESVFRRFEQDSRIAELALARCHAQVNGIKAKIITKQNSNQMLAETWNLSLQASSTSSIESRLVLLKERQALVELQRQLQDGLADVEQARETLVEVLRRLRSIELIREKDLAEFERELKIKNNRDALEIVLRKSITSK